MIRSSFQKIDDAQSIDVSISREVGTEYDNIKIVSDNIESVVDVADVIKTPLFDNIETVVDNLDTINNVATTIVPNIDEILLADTNATIATTKASEASDSEAIATTKASEALSSANASEASRLVSDANKTATNADVVLTNADVVTATTQADIATTKAGEAGVSASNALASETQAGIYASQLDPTKIVAKDSPTGSAMMPVGTTAQRPVSPQNGYMRYNTDLVSMEVYSNGAWGSVGGGATGGGTDHIFYENSQVITADYTIPVGKNAMSAGDITINSGITVTVPSGSKWVII